MVVKEVEYNDFSEFIHDISPTKGSKKYQNCIFRGECGIRKLLPTALREKGYRHLNFAHSIEERPSEFLCMNAEYDLLLKFYTLSNANGLLYKTIDEINSIYFSNIVGISTMHLQGYKVWLPENLFEIAALAQHYGVPTRLLDWTQDYKVALYFAAQSAIRKMNKDFDENEKIIVWALDLNFVSFINQRAGFPLKYIIPSYSQNPNLYAQRGVLTLWQTPIPNDARPVDTTPLDELINKYCNQPGINVTEVLYKISLPAKDCKAIYQYVEHEGYDAARLFPGFQGVVKKMTEEYLI